MSLLNQLNDDIKQAMRSKDKDRLNVIRMVKAALQNEAIHLGVKELATDDELTILSRELKQRNESLSEFKAAGRDDLCEKLEKEIAILHDYMPEPLSNEKLKKIVQEAIITLNVCSKKDFGKVMGYVMPRVKGKADGTKIQQLVQQLLSE
jgi:uncharacterized protein YqeY